MSNVQIPNLPSAIFLNGTEEIEAVQGGVSVRVTSAQIAGLGITGPTGPIGQTGSIGVTGPTGPTGGSLPLIAPPGVPINAPTYLVSVTDGTLLFLAINCTVTLPVASSCAGKILIMNTLSANSVISSSSNVYPLGGEILGTSILPAQSAKFVMLQSDGANWRIILSN